MEKYAFRNIKTIFFFFIAIAWFPLPVRSSGFFAHKHINRYAITTLPPAMFAFYKTHLTCLTEKSVNPDKRRYVLENEAQKHFIDLEIYRDSLFHKQKLSFSQAVATYGYKTIATHGSLPWAILDVQKKLTAAFKDKNITKILKLSADLGHYVADAHVPLHTTQNYDGQITGQEGVHALWETRLPFLFFDSYNFFVGQALYIEDPLSHVWAIVLASHALVDKLLGLEKQLSLQHPITQKYSFEQQGTLLKKQYALAFATAYHKELKGQVESRLQQSIIQVGNFWLTAWVNAGSPDLKSLIMDLPVQHEEDKLLEAGHVLEGIRQCGEET